MRNSVRNLGLRRDARERRTVSSDVPVAEQNLARHRFLAVIHVLARRQHQCPVQEDAVACGEQRHAAGFTPLDTCHDEFRVLDSPTDQALKLHRVAIVHELCEEG